MTAAEQVNNVESSEVEAVPFRVFVGNLSYDVDTDKLKEYFSQAGNVTDAIAVRRYGRSAGYGFVTFEDDAAVEKAVALKETELEGRQINVERAVPRDPNAPRTNNGRRGRGGRGGRRGNNRRRKEPYTGELSSITVFVGNLPYHVVDQDLKNIFEGFNVSNAHVVRMHNGNSRGFGFVTLASAEEQTAALEKLTEVYCDDRKLLIRAAISDEPYPTAAEKAEAATATAAVAADVSATA